MYANKTKTPQMKPRQRAANEPIGQDVAAPTSELGNLTLLVSQGAASTSDYQSRPSPLSGTAGDFIERTLLKTNPSFVVVARGLDEWESMGESQRDMAQKVRKALQLAIQLIKGAQAALTIGQKTNMTKAITGALLGGTVPTEQIYKKIVEKLRPVETTITSRTQLGNDRIVVYRKTEMTEAAFVRKGDPHSRIFFEERAIKNSDVGTLAHTLIHEITHQRARTEDVFYLNNTHSFGLPTTDGKLKSVLMHALTCSMNIPKLGRSDPRVDASWYKIVEEDIAKATGHPATTEDIFLANADTLAFLVVGLGGAKVFEQFAKDNPELLDSDPHA